MIEKWAKNIKDEKNSFDYISKFTKDCPNCNTGKEENKTPNYGIIIFLSLK